MGVSLGLVRKTFVWMLGFFSSLSRKFEAKNSQKKKLKSLRLIQETHKNHTKWFFRSRTCIWCCYLSAPTVHVSAFFLLFFSIIYRPISFLFFVFVLFFTSILFFSFCEFCVGIQWKKIYLLMQVNIQARTYKKNSSFFSLISLNRNIERSALLSRAHNIHLAL